MASRIPWNRTLAIDAIDNVIPTDAHIESLIAADLVPYSTTAQTTTAISSALVPYATTAATTSAISTALASYSTTAQMTTAISNAISAALASYSTTSAMTTAISNAILPYGPCIPAASIRCKFDAGPFVSSGYAWSQAAVTSYPVSETSSPAAGAVGFTGVGTGIIRCTRGASTNLPAFNLRGWVASINNLNGDQFSAQLLQTSATVMDVKTYVGTTLTYFSGTSYILLEYFSP